MSGKKRIYTTTEAAAELGVTRSRIRHMIRDKRLPAHKPFGRDWMILPKHIDLVRDRKPGRPLGSKDKKKRAPRKKI